MGQLTQWLRRGFGIVLIAGLAACGSGDDYEGFDASVSQSTPNRYLLFFNRQGDLPAGTYTLVVATNTGNQAGTFSVTYQKNDGSATQLITGSWTDSFGPSANPETTCAGSPSNRCYTISLADARGASFTLNTALDGVLYLVDDSGTPQIIATANAGGAGVAETLTFAESEIDGTEFATAYYAAIDPIDARATAQQYIAMHGLDTPDVQVIFRDSKDLGYGRDMYMRVYRNDTPPDPGPVPGPPCGPAGAVTVAFFVRNFSVKIVEGFAYGPVNLEAAIAEDLQHHIGTNAIEFGLGRSDYGDTCSTEPMAKFFTFEPDYDSTNAPHLRRLRVDLDARGAKAMPQPCITCHGGKLRPLDRNGDFVAMHAQDPVNQIGDTKARMQAFEVDTFEFSDQAGYRRVDSENNLRLLNAAIYCTYPGSNGHPACAGMDFDGDGTGGVAPQNNEGEWSGDFGREMMLGWYGDDGVNDALANPNSVFDGSFVPNGWTPSAPGGPPAGADALFTKVVGPNCFVCHGKRGTELGSNSSAGSNSDATDGKDLDFGSWDKFISHADEIERLVFEEGRMPLGLLNFQNFWGDPEKAELLASFIAPYVTDSAGFQARRTDSDGNILEPGSRVVARAGPDRVTSPGGTITLNAQASLFADSYRWQIISSPGSSSPTLSSPNSMQTDFSAATPGEYTLRMTASGSESGSSASDTLIVEVDAALATAPRDLMFYNDVRTRLITCASDCHSAGGGANGGVVANVPVWWADDASQPIPAPPTVTPTLGFFEQVMARVNLEFIEDSLILKKPSNQHHYGGLQGGFNTSLDVGAAGRADYDMFVNWIAEGAACGGTATQCPR